jgi:uncharacterized protein (TIGR02001 family)
MHDLQNLEIHIMPLRKTLSLAILSTLAVSPFTAQAATQIGDAEITANVGFVTEYSFRGIAQSNEEPAMQGGFDVTHTSGLYAGVWGSNVEFGDASLETDVYAGYSNSAGKFNYDVGAIYYAYPGTDSDNNYDFYEVSAAVGYDFDLFAVSASVNYSPEFFADSGHAEYYAAGVDVPLPHDLNLNAHIGRQNIQDNAAFGAQDYTDWGVGLGYNWQGFDFSLSYVDTDLDEPTECADGCDSKVIFGISRSF